MSCTTKNIILYVKHITFWSDLSFFLTGLSTNKKGAIKLHTLLDFDCNLPVYVNITYGNTANNKGTYDLPLIKNSVIVADRFYNDFHLLNVWDSNKVFFVIRHKHNLKFIVIKEVETIYNQHILKDEIIELTKKFKLGLYQPISLYISVECVLKTS